MFLYAASKGSFPVFRSTAFLSSKVAPNIELLAASGCGLTVEEDGVVAPKRLEQVLIGAVTTKYERIAGGSRVTYATHP
jgi:hypothetical protein